MASTTNQISMTSTAAIIIASNTNRKRLYLKNVGSNTVYIGPDSSIVDTANSANGAYPIFAGQTFVMSDYTGVVYGICTSGQTSTMAFIEEDLS